MSKLSELLTSDSKPSKFERIIAELGEEDRAAVEKALEDRNVSHERIALALTQSGHRVSRESVRMYRLYNLDWIVGN